MEEKIKKKMYSVSLLVRENCGHKVNTHLKICKVEAMNEDEALGAAIREATENITDKELVLWGVIEF